MAFEVPYHRAIIGAEEIAAVTSALESGWLTMGPRVAAFEDRFARHLGGGTHAVAVSSCTAGLFLALRALELPEGSEVITTPYSFAATANVIYHNRLKPVFADIDSATLNIDPKAIAAQITPNTSAILPVHIGGNPCDMDAILALADQHGLKVVEDCAHAAEGSYQGKALGTLGDAGAFSFYPTKNLTTAEGGLITTQNVEMADRLRLLRNHGLDRSAHARENTAESYVYDIRLPGYKYTLSDLQAAVGLAQMDRLVAMSARRQAIKAKYDAAFSGLQGVALIKEEPKGKSALHLYILKLDADRDRSAIMQGIRERGVQLSVNYQPIHLFSWYRKTYGYNEGDFPHAEACGAKTFSLPFYPALTDSQIDKVIETVSEVLLGK